MSILTSYEIKQKFIVCSSVYNEIKKVLEKQIQQYHKNCSESEYQSKEAWYWYNKKSYAQMHMETLGSIDFFKVYEVISMTFPKENVHKHMLNVVWKVLHEDTIFNNHLYTVEEYIDCVLSFR